MRVPGPARRPVGWNCTISMSRSGRPARSAIAMPSQDLSPDGVWYLYIVGPPPVASSVALRPHEQRRAGAHVEHAARRRAPEPSAAGISSTRAVLLEPPHVAPPDLLGEPVDDLDAGEVALVHGAVEGLPGERLLVDRAVRVAVEEAAELVLQLADAHAAPRDEQPGEVLVVEPLAALDRVHEVALDRVAGRERDVVAALHHAGAAAFAEQALHRDGDVELGRRLLGVQRREQPGAAGAEDEDVGVEGGQGAHHEAPAQIPSPCGEG